MSEDVEREIGEAAYGRRTFLRRLAIGSAFAVPVVSSFSMAGIQAVSANANPGVSNCNSTLIGLNSTTSINCANQAYYESGRDEIWALLNQLHHI